jgi:hypothetical protein
MAGKMTKVKVSRDLSYRHVMEYITALSRNHSKSIGLSNSIVALCQMQSCWGERRRRIKNWQRREWGRRWKSQEMRWQRGESGRMNRAMTRTRLRLRKWWGQFGNNANTNSTPQRWSKFLEIECISW